MMARSNKGYRVNEVQRVKMVELVKQGITYKHIAERFGISDRTVGYIVCKAREMEKEECVYIAG